MAFHLYDLSGPRGRERYTRVHPFPLAGKKGPLAQLVAMRNEQKSVPFGWHSTSDELITLHGGTPTTQAIVIDLKPNVPNNVSLYRLLDVWGYSYTNWTPLAFRLQALFVDRHEPDPTAFKRSFVDAGEDHRLAGEFLYVHGGVTGGDWNWGKVGHVNGVLLWKEAFDFLYTGLSQGMKNALSDQ
jgi:hypothetical protein